MSVIPSMHASAAMSATIEDLTEQVIAAAVERWAKGNRTWDELLEDIEDEHGELGREIARVIVAVRKASVEREQG